MGYIITIVFGAFCGALAVWLFVMGYFEKAKEKEEAAKETLEKVKSEAVAIADKERELLANRDKFQQEWAEFQARVVSYKEIQHENTLLKRDLQNMDVMTNKLEMDGEIRQRRSDEVDERSKKLASRYLAETVKSVVAAVGPNNFSACKQRLSDVIGRCREIGFPITPEEETKLMADLRSEFEKEVRAEFQREEQARIKSKIREDEKLKQEIDRELQQLERERLAIQAALDQAMQVDANSIQVQQLKARIAEIEQKEKRKMSLAQQTKAGHVYIISNVGSLGANVFKVGMSRRQDPYERVDELGSASVPFPFDVHMMIWTKDAPALEHALHRSLFKQRINKANPRKEFFRSTFDEIQKLVVAQGGEIKFTADPTAEPLALEYNQSRTMSDEDAAIIDEVFSKAEAETAGENVED